MSILGIMFFLFNNWGVIWYLLKTFYCLNIKLFCCPEQKNEQRRDIRSVGSDTAAGADEVFQLPQDADLLHRRTAHFPQPAPRSQAGS